MTWPFVRLSDLAEFRNGVNYDRRNFGTGIRVVGVADFQDFSTPRWSALDEINPEGVVTERNTLREGDLLFVRSNGNRALIGRSLYIPAPAFPVTHSAFTIRVRFTTPSTESRFFAYLFRTPMLRKALEAHGGGTNISNLSQAVFAKLHVPLPTLEMQRRIAGVLSAYDDLIENCERRIELLYEMARALYREWFEFLRYPGHQKAPPQIDSPIGRIPAGWRAGAVRDLTSFLSRGISPKYDENGPSIVINQKCIRDFRLDRGPARRQSKPFADARRVRSGDILINSTGVGTLGRVAQVLEDLGDCTVDSHVTIARPHAATDSTFFGIALLQLQPTFERRGTGATGQAELSRLAIGGELLRVPPLELQLKFAENARPMRNEIRNLQTRAENLRNMRDLLLPRLLSGGLSLNEAA